LIELMIVVAIVGILAVLGAYGVRKYIANSKTAEARNAIGRMANAATIEYEREHMQSATLPQAQSAGLSRTLCKSASQPVPASASLVAGTKYQSSWSDWSVDSAGDSGFACLRFTIELPQYYMYTYTSMGSGNVGDSFTAMANGDLDGNGTLSTFQLAGAVAEGYVVNVAPNMAEISPDE
jgi:type IV pilus assembly protein PilA